MTIKHTVNHYDFKRGAEQFPLMVVLSFVYICNAKCPNCPYNNSKLRDLYRDAMVMPDSIFKKIADECGQYHAYLRISGGGEPMLHPNATELLVYAKQKGVKVGLITNGSKFTKDNLTELIRSGIDVIEFSVDAGDEETYSQVRPGLDWNRLNDNVESALRLRKSLNADTVIIASIINQVGVDVEYARQYWEKTVDNVQIRKYLTWGYNKDRSADASPYLIQSDDTPCPWLFERVNIDSRGDVTLCGEDIAFNQKFASIKDRSIKEIWLGEEFSELRRKHLTGRRNEIPICKTCPDWQFRSWTYNYWRVIDDADRKNQTKAHSFTNK